MPDQPHAPSLAGPGPQPAALARGRAPRFPSWLGWALFFVALYGVACATRDFWVFNEARRARIAMEMLHRGDWVVPHLAGQPILTKPPLFYWLQAIAFELTGQFTPWAARLPSLLAAVAGIAALGWALSRLLARGAARFGAAVLGLMPVYYWMAQSAESEMLFVSFGTLAMACFIGLMFNGDQSRAHQRAWLAGLYLALGLSIMTKLLITPLVLALTWISWGLLQRGRPRPAMRSWLGLGLILLPGVLWLVALAMHGQDLTMIWREIDAHLDDDAPHARPVTFYFDEMDAMFFPWPWLLALALIDRLQWAWAHGARSPRALWSRLREWLWRDRGERLLLVLWAAWAMIVLSLSPSKRYYYAVNLAPPLAGLCALAWHDWAPAVATRFRRFFRVIGGRWLGVVLGVAAVFGLAAWLVTPDELPQPFDGEDSLDDPLLFAVTAIWIAGFGLLAAWRARRGRWRGLARASLRWTLLVTAGLAVYCTMVVHPRINQVISSRRIASEVAAHIPAGAPLFSAGEVHALCFYWGRPELPQFDESDELREWLRRNPGAVGVAQQKNLDEIQEVARYQTLYVTDFVPKSLRRVKVYVVKITGLL